METDSTIEFEFFLAEKLGRTREELLKTISEREFLGWSVYYGRRAQERQLAQRG